jgi:hypothetical protein
MTLGVAALVLASAGCGGDDDDGGARSVTSASTAQDATATTLGRATGTAPEYVDAIAAVIRADEAFSAVPPQDARCAANGVVAAVGIETLHELGISPDQIREERRLPAFEGNLDEEQAQGVAGALLDCIDFGRVIGGQIATSVGQTLTEEQAQCINTRVEGDPGVRAAIASAYTGTPVEGAAPDLDVFALAAECLPYDISAPGGTGQ